MKKIKFLSFLLALCLALHGMLIPVFASESTEPAATEPSETVPSEGAIAAVPDVEYGSASITNGCRTINGMTPHGGSDRILESSQAAFVYDANTQTVIYSYNPDQRLMPGILTKIMTAMIAIENMDPETKITCSTQWNKSLPWDAQDAKIKEGEVLTLNDLLHCMIVGSANDAALIIANNIAPNEAAFVEMMNQKARQIGCTDTNFANCTGLDNSDQYTTARDMARITLEAYKNSYFRDLFSATGYTVAPTERTENERTFITGNYLMSEAIISKFYNSKVTGGMASNTGGSGASLAFMAENKGMSVVMIVMGAVRTYNDKGNAQYYGNFEEATKLLSFTFNGYKVTRLLYPGQTLDQFPVNGGDTKVTGQSEIAIDTVLPAKVFQKHLIYRYEVEGGGLSAPIEKDELIGTVQVWYGTSCITEAQLFAANPVRLASNSGVEIYGASRDDSNVTDILTFLGIAALVIIIPFGIYVGVNRLRRAMRLAKRRRRRRSRRRSR